MPDPTESWADECRRRDLGDIDEPIVPGTLMPAAMVLLACVVLAAATAWGLWVVL